MGPVTALLPWGMSYWSVLKQLLTEKPHITVESKMAYMTLITGFTPPICSKNTSHYKKYIR